MNHDDSARCRFDQGADRFDPDQYDVAIKLIAMGDIESALATVIGALSSPPLRYDGSVMRRRYHLSRRHRTLWIGAVLFCLLFQQLAMAAYVCPLPTVPVGQMMTGECAAMSGNTAKATPAHQSPDPRCVEHCANHATTVHDARVPMVPPLLLPPSSTMLSGTITHAPEASLSPGLALRRSDPPPILRFCTLLI